MIEAWCLFLNEISDNDGKEAFIRAGRSTQYGDLEPGHIVEIVMELQSERFERSKREDVVKEIPWNDAPKGSLFHEENKKRLRALILEKFPNIYDEKPIMLNKPQQWKEHPDLSFEDAQGWNKATQPIRCDRTKQPA